MTQPTDLQLQLALAEELPDLIWTRGAIFIWKDNGAHVSYREWNWIVQECEKKLTPAHQMQFMFQMDYLCECLRDGSRLDQWKLVSAPWSTRAIAYFETINKTIV